MKNKLLKILGVVMTIAMLASFMVAGAGVSASGNPASINNWSGVKLPSLAAGSDVQLIEQANDGTIFVSVWYSTDPDGSGPLLANKYNMYKSTDGGYTWTLTNVSNQTSAITVITPSANYAVDKTVYVAIAGTSVIMKCTNAAAAGTPFGLLGQISGGFGGALTATQVNDIETYYDGSYDVLLVATDIDVFAIRDDNGLTTVWTDMQLSQALLGGYSDSLTTPVGVDVFKAMFAPDYASTGVIWAVYFDNRNGVTTTATNGYGIIARPSGSNQWGSVITPVIVSAPGNLVAKPQCDVKFAANYSSLLANGNVNLYAALSFYGATAADDVYSIECNFYGSAGSVTPFSVTGATHLDFSSLQISGSTLIAGSNNYGTGNAQVWVSLNNGITWNIASKNPTGALDLPCNLLISGKSGVNGANFVADGTILAATSGAQSAVSISADNGATWNQIAFIDDVIATIGDIAFSSTSHEAALITSNGADSSLWKTKDVTALTPQWQRVLCQNYSTTINGFTLVEFSADSVVVMLYDMPANEIYRSADDLQTFSSWRSTVGWGTIADWVVSDSTSVYAATSNGFWSTAVVGQKLATTPLVSIAKNGNTLIVGSTAGKIYASANSGSDWGSAITALGTAGNVYVAFDSGFAVSGSAGNGLIFYATSNGTVGQVKLSSTAAVANSNVVLTDAGGTGIAAAGTSYNAIKVAPDNALYVSGSTGNSTTTTTTSTVPISGTVTLSSSLFNNHSVTIPGGTLINVTNGTFVAGGVSVSGSDLTANSSTSVVGRIYIEQGTAQGYIDVTLSTGSYWTSGSDISVSASSLTCTPTTTTTTTTVSGTTKMFRLLLHQTDNLWETAPLTGMSGLWYSAGSNILWTKVNNTISAFEDFLSGPVAGVTAIEKGASTSTATKTVTVSWTNAKVLSTIPVTYLISYSYVNSLGTTVTAYATKTVVAGTATGAAISSDITGLNPYTAYTFMVRVADGSPYQSRWSDTKSVTTSFYIMAPALQTLANGTLEAPINPSFTWAAAAGASQYEFQLSTDPAFATANIIVDAKVATTAYSYNTAKLAFDTDHFWRVRSIASDGTATSAWSSVWSFHTRVQAIPPVTVTQISQTQTLVVSGVITTIAISIPPITINPPVVTVPPGTTVVTSITLTVPHNVTPSYIWAIVAIGALLTIAVIILIIRTRRVV